MDNIILFVGSENNIILAKIPPLAETYFQGRVFLLENFQRGGHMDFSNPSRNTPPY